MADFYTFGSGGLQEAVRQVFAKLKTLLDGKYTKPSGGIPASDMAQAVQTSLGLADTALQAVPNTYRTASAQDVIDSNKATVILDTASGSVASFPDGIPAACKKLVVNIVPNQSGTGDPSSENIRAISGWSSATVYSSGADMSNPDDIVYSFPQAAGTVYGGTLTINEDGTGSLVVDFALHVFNGTESFETGGYIDNPFMHGRPNGADWPFGSSTNKKGICSALKCTQGHFHYWDEGTCCMVTSGPYTYFVFKSSSFGSTVEEVKGKIRELYEAGTPLVYAGPIRSTYIQTYQLTSQQVIDIVYGINNIWADCGDVEVTYRADTKLYIQKINAPSDDNMTADTQIASGKYFIIGNTLYKSTTVIPAGDTVIPGTNCIKTNLAEALNALNT